MQNWNEIPRAQEHITILIIRTGRAQKLIAEMVHQAIIPARFLSLTAHLVLTIMLYWSRVSLLSMRKRTPQLLLRSVALATVTPQFGQFPYYRNLMC